MDRERTNLAKLPAALRLAAGAWLLAVRHATGESGRDSIVSVLIGALRRLSKAWRSASSVFGPDWRGRSRAMDTSIDANVSWGERPGFREVCKRNVPCFPSLDGARRGFAMDIRGGIF